MDYPNRLEELVQAYENTLLRTALAILRDKASAEDAVYETFLRYLEKRPRLADANHEKAWLLRVTINSCRSCLRARRRHPTTELSEGWYDTYPGTNEEVEVWDAVSALSPKERAAVHLFYYEGYSAEEIASLTGQRPGTVRAQLSRARSRLKTWLS